MREFGPGVRAGSEIGEAFGSVEAKRKLSIVVEEIRYDQILYGHQWHGLGLNDGFSRHRRRYWEQYIRFEDTLMRGEKGILGI